MRHKNERKQFCVTPKFFVFVFFLFLGGGGRGAIIKDKRFLFYFCMDYTPMFKDAS